MEGAGSEVDLMLHYPTLTLGLWHTCLTMAALPGGDYSRIPADRVGDNAGKGHALVFWSQRNPQQLSICEEAMWLDTKVNGPLLSPAIGYVTDVGDPTGQESLAGLEGLRYSNEHLYRRPGYCIWAKIIEQVWVTGVLGRALALALGSTPG